jgi:hypothetical protein
MPLIAQTIAPVAAGHPVARDEFAKHPGRTVTDLAVHAGAITQDSSYTASQTSANAVSVLSQAHSENSVSRSGKPRDAIFICSAGEVS